MGTDASAHSSAPGGRPLVAVVIPTRDRPELVARAIRSVLGQTLTALELVVVDDGSARPLPDVLASDPRTSLLRNDVSGGVSNARNRGIAASRAPYVAFLDDDDAWRPDKLEIQVSAMERAGADFSFTGAVKTHADGRGTIRPEVPKHPDLIDGLIERNCVGGPSTVVVSRALLDRVGGFDPELSVVADWELWLRLAAAGTPLFVPDETTALLAHAGSMQRVEIDHIEAELAYMARVHQEVLRSRGRAFPSPTTLTWLAALRWRTTPTVRTGARYVRAAFRSGHVRRIAKGIVRRRVIRRMDAPSWAVALLSG